MNETIQLLKNHTSIRKFDLDYQIPKEDFQAILDATRQASTWMNGEFYSILVIKNQATREKIYELAPPHMTFIKKCNELLVFVGDLHRTEISAKMHAAPYEATGIEPLLMGTVDASLAAQNTMIAAESLGLGGVVIGMIRPHATEIAELLGLPDKTFPLFAIALGKPAQEMKVKPRLPQRMVVHDETYKEPTEADFKEYDATQTAYAGERQSATWTEKFARYFAAPKHKESESQLKAYNILEK